MTQRDETPPNADDKEQNQEQAIEQGELVEPDEALAPVTLEDLPDICRQAATHANWSELMPVQARTIPYVLAGRDLMVQSRTGSGKTGAFILPMLARIDSSRKTCQVLILVPTRELAVQVEKEAKMLSAGSDIGVVSVYGGVGYKQQIDAFNRGVQLVVGTPGRVLDHLLRKTLSLKGLDVLIFDEADRMLSMGFFQDMIRLKSFMSDRPRNGYMFSATFPPHVTRLAGHFLDQPEVLSLSRDHVHVTDVEHVFYHVPERKERALVRLIEMENPASALIFCNTKSRVEFVTTVLQRFGYDADQLTSDLSQNARQHVLDRVRKGSLRLLVATDLAARGIDIAELSHVYQFDIPEDSESYIHRAGRTGRAGATGSAVALVNPLEHMELRKIAMRYKIDFQERDLPSDADVEAVVSQRVIASLEAKRRGLDSIQLERMERFMALGRTLADTEDELPLIAMLLDDFYQPSLHKRLLPAVGDFDDPANRRPERSSGRSGGRSGRSSRDRSGRSGGGSRPRRR